MSALITFGICMALTIVLLVVVMSILGGSSSMLILIFPAMIAQSITGERGLFSPNGSGPQSILFSILLSLFVILEIALVSSVFFGLYCLFWGWPATEATIVIDNEVYSKATILRLQIINTLLLLLDIYFVGMFTFSTVKHWSHFRQMKTGALIIHRIIPLISLPLSLIYLVVSYVKLTEYPHDPHLSYAIKAIGILCVIYLLYSLGRSIYHFSIITRSGLSELKFQYWFSFGLSLCYNVLFLYFFYNMQTLF